MKIRRTPFTITVKGRAVLHGPTVWGLSSHLRDLLALCDPGVTLDQLQQWLPPESLRASLYALRELGLVDGPAVEAPDAALWMQPRALRRSPAGAHS